MRVSLCLGVVLCASSGCFLDHGAPGEEARAADPSARYEAVCSLSPAAEYPKALTFYRTTSCDEAPREGCEVSGPIWPALGSPHFAVSTPEVGAPDCGGASTFAASATCDLPIEGVGDYDVLLDRAHGIHLTIPYESPFGASCWTFGGECETGGVGRVELPAEIAAGAPHLFTAVELRDLDTPLPDACIVTIEDGRPGASDERPRIHVSLTFDGAAPDDACVGIGRRATCALPPLEVGTYAVMTIEGEAAELRVR